MIYFFISFFLIFGIDRLIKTLFLEGFIFNSKCISLEFVLNKGVAFSMFEFLGEYLKFIQLFLLLFLFFIFYKEKFLKEHQILSGVLFGASVSNLLDRFLFGGVVDYVYWHCYFDFAIFNFADVMIDFAILGFVYFYIFKKDVKIS